MNKLTKQCRIIAVLGAIVFCACVFASCWGEEPRHFYIRNTHDEEISVSLYYHKPGYQARNNPHLGTFLYSKIIPANSTVEFEVGWEEDGTYEARVTLPDGTYVRKYVGFGNMWSDTWYGESYLVIF